MKDIKIISNELFLQDDYATIEEVKGLNEPNKNELRVYCHQFPNSFNVQIRTHKGIGFFNKGKPRDMIATICLDIEEMKEILKYMKDYKNRK